MMGSRLLGAALALVLALPAAAGPTYDPGRDDLEWVMARLAEWLPGAWDSFPHVYYERTVRAPADGEHEHWHRSFALIDAPQVGDVVFYGQVNVDGRDGPLLPRSQIVYKVRIDEDRGAVVMNGQPPLDPERFVNLQDRPALWGEVQMRDEAALHCDFLWRRDGEQLYAVLEGKAAENRKYGPGTCTYVMRGTDAEFFADAEWVLGPETLWVYDINTIRGAVIVGREDRTHTRYARTRGYACEIRDAAGTRRVAGHDLGFEAPVAAGRDLEMLLLRAEYPASPGGLEPRLRLMLRDPAAGETLAFADAPPGAGRVALTRGDVALDCRRDAALPPLGPAG